MLFLAILRKIIFGVRCVYMRCQHVTLYLFVIILVQINGVHGEDDQEEKAERLG